LIVDVPAELVGDVARRRDEVLQAVEIHPPPRTADLVVDDAFFLSPTAGAEENGRKCSETPQAVESITGG
jgi:hypothetical protein